jgi:hypothetical protein
MKSMAFAQRHRDFQWLAVQLAKTKWPELEATQEQSDGGEDATSFFVGSDGKRRCLACSLTGTLAKIKQDAERLKERNAKLDVLIFMTPVELSNVTIDCWCKTVKTEFAYELHVIPQSELIAMLEKPDNAWLCRDRLKLDFSDAYASESLQAQTIALDKPKYWEYLLTAELLETNLAEIRRRREQQKSGLIHIPSRPIAARDFIDWVTAKCGDILSMVSVLQNQIKDIQDSWGPHGQPGDADKIKRSVGEVIRLCDQLVDWEEAHLAINPPDAFIPLKNSMSGMTDHILLEIEKLPTELRKPLQVGDPTTGTVVVNLILTTPPMDRCLAELDALRKHRPPLW